MTLLALFLHRCPRPRPLRLIRFAFIAIAILLGGLLLSMRGERDYRPLTADRLVEAEHANRASLPPGGKRRP